MASNRSLKWAVLVGLLVLPFLVYFFWVYTTEQNFFITLDYVGPKSVSEVVNDEGEMVYDTAYYTVPSWEFTTQDDTSLSSSELRGNMYLANFFFTTCPTICPAMNYHVQQVQNRFKGYENFRIVSFSVDPDYDNPEVLKKYEKTIGAISGKWYFLTGEMDSIYETANDYFLSAMVDPTAEGGFLHSENLVLVDWEGHIRSRRDDKGNIKAVYNSGSAEDINQLKDDIKVLIAEYEKKKSVDEYRRSKEEKHENP